MADPIYRAEGVSFLYGKSYALKDVSFAIESGESIAMLGANGSGKSTLLKLLDGLIFPSSGKVLYQGRPLTEASLGGDFLRCFRSAVGFVFSEPDVQLFCPTVSEELAFGPLQLGLSEAEVSRRVEDTAAMLGLAALKTRPPYGLSSGEKKKVAIASVLTMNPEVLLLDEPTNGLDPRTQVWLFELLAALRELKKTIIIATHDLSLVEDLTDRAVVLDEGHGVAADGTTAKVLADKDLLLKVNIIHEHAHRHGDIVHRHSHGPYSTHDEHE